MANLTASPSTGTYVSPSLVIVTVMTAVSPRVRLIVVPLIVTIVFYLMLR